MFLFVFWIINFGVPQIFHIKVFPDFKKIKNHWCRFTSRFCVSIQFLLIRLESSYINQQSFGNLFKYSFADV